MEKQGLSSMNNNNEKTNIVDLLNEKGFSNVTQADCFFEKQHWMRYQAHPKVGVTFSQEEISVIIEIDNLLRATFINKVASYVRKREVEVFELRIYTRPFAVVGELGFEKIHIS
jgi:hypothetical protein